MGLDLGGVASNLGSIFSGGGSGGAGGGGLGSLAPLLLLEGVKQGFGVLEGGRQEKLADDQAKRDLEMQVAIQELRNSGALDQLRERVAADMELARLRNAAEGQQSALAAASAGARNSTDNRSRIAQALINAIIQGGAGEANALQGIPKTVGNIR